MWLGPLVPPYQSQTVIGSSLVNLIDELLRGFASTDSKSLYEVAIKVTCLVGKSIQHLLTHKSHHKGTPKLSQRDKNDHNELWNNHKETQNFIKKSKPTIKLETATESTKLRDKETEKATKRCKTTQKDVKQLQRSRHCGKDRRVWRDGKKGTALSSY